jgi:hypothetical protein
MREAMMIGVVLVAAAGGGCGGDVSGSRGTPAGVDAAAARVEIGGWYRVTSDVDGPCGMPMPVAAILAPAYLRVEARQDIFIIYGCRSQAESDCGGAPFYDFTMPIANGWAAVGGSSFWSAGCTLVWEHTEATLSGAELHIESRRNQVNRDVPESACTLTAAAAVTECKSEEEMKATRL